jgi:hypothetical protein
MLRLSPLRLRCCTIALLALSSGLALQAQKKASKPAPKPAAHPAASGAHPATVAHGPTTGGVHPTTASHPLAAHGPMSHPGPARDREVRTANGGAVRMRPNGRPADFHDPGRGMDIHHNLAGGGRRISVERADHSRLVYERGRAGYIAHPYSFHGHEFARRVYYFHGRAYNRFYNPYFFHGVHFEVYAPYRFYSVGFYGWAYHPWLRPVPYAWGFGVNPWYGYYGGYFTPYPVYASPALWLTDYMISQSLEANYEAAAAAGPPQPLGADVSPLSPDVKQMVADEVQRQLALENSEAQMNTQGQAPDPNSSSIARQLSDGQVHSFVAGAEVDVVDTTTGQECAVTDGDVLQLTTPPAADASEAMLTVMSSKGGNECRKMAVVNVPLEDLQEMQNHMRETLDQGLADLQTKQGKGGLPAAPPSAMAAPVNAAFTQDAPAPEPGGEQELLAEAKQADQSEQELTSATASGPSAAAATDTPPPPAAAAPPASINITPGQSIADVKAALGEPTRIVNLGTKSIYVYKDMKITFISGKVSDIQ